MYKTKKLHLLFRFYKEHIRGYKRKILIIWLLHVLFSGALVVPPYLIKQLIDEGIVNKDLNLIWLLAIIVIGIFALVALIDKVQVFWGHIIAQKITYNLRNDLYSHLQKLSFSFYDDIKTGELISRIIDDINVVEEVLYHGPENLIISGCTLLFAGIIVFYLNWKLALASLIVIPAIVVFGYIISLRMFKGFREVKKKKASLSSRVEDNFSGMRTIQSFVRESYEMGRFDRENKGHYRSRVNVISPMSWLFPVSVLILGVSLAIAASYGGYQVISGEMTVGTLTAFIMYLQRFISPLLTLAMISEMLTRFLASIERYFKYMDMHPDIKDSPEAISLQKVNGDIQFKNVWFKYDK